MGGLESRVFWKMLILLPWLVSCAPKATRDGAVKRATRYAEMVWIPSAENVRHGKDSNGTAVHTPNRSTGWDGAAHSWWQPGKPARGMPYQWGGFDTPESFGQKIAAGYKAGDVGNGAKRELGDDGVSAESCGIDCSGFVSRCWNLPRPYSTRELPAICERLASWDDLQPGDILLNHRHVVLFVKWLKPGKTAGIYEAGPFPVWRVNANGIDRTKLVRNGYAPWRYRGMED